MFIFIFLLGTIIGSFLNVCIYRIPREESIVYPPSHCPNCSVPLHWYDLIPILSYILQKGKCRYCGDTISLQYPIVEFLNGILYSSLYYKFGLTIDFVFYEIIFSVLIVISLIDLYFQIIPNPLNILIFITTIIYKILRFKLYDISPNIMDSLWGLFISSSIFLIIAIVSKGGMGGGDLKLIGVLGFILGVKMILLNIFLSFMFGAIISIFLLLFKIKGRKDPIPFGPFICLAFMITKIFGENIVIWYVFKFLR